MSIFFWKTWRNRQASRNPSKASRRCRLELERLEDRIVPSVTLLSHYTGLDSAFDVTNNNAQEEPPDTQGAAGPSSVIETVNQGIGIYSPKNTGTNAVTDTLTDFFFTKGGLPHLTVASGDMEGQSDPFTIYDPQVNRFITEDIDFEVDSNGNTVNNGANALLIAVSKNSNPTTLTNSSWYFYEISTSESGIALQDYPGNPGYNADALVITQASFTSTGTIAHTLVTSVSMNSLINGGPLTTGTNVFQSDIGEVLPRPTIMPDSTPGGPMWMEAAQDGGFNTGPSNTIDVLKMTNVLSANPTFTTTTLNVNTYYPDVVGLNPDGTPTDTFADSRMLQSAESNGLIATTQEVSDAAGDADFARWYELNVSSGSPVLMQQGDVGGGPGIYDRYPGININSQGDIGMTYMQSGTSPGQFESMFVTGRTPSDPPETMETPVLVQQGTSNYVGSREGDMTRVDVDANGSFWAFGQWANNEGAPNWGTGIGNFSLTPPLSILLTSATEGQPLNNVPVATFIDDSGVPLTSYTATINWGDGTVTSGTVVPGNSPGSFVILGSNTYINPGDYTLTVTENNGLATLGPVSGTVAVADAPLEGSAEAINGETAEFVNNALVAVFKDTDSTLRPTSQYTATILWNEGNNLTFSSAGTIVTLTGNTFEVFGSAPFTFPNGGLFPVVVVVRDLNGGASVTITSKLNVAHNPAIPPLVPQYQDDTNPENSQFIAMEDALNNLLNAERLFMLALSFGTMKERSGTFGNLVNALLAYENDVLAYDVTLPGS